MSRERADYVALCAGGLIATSRLRTLAEIALSVGQATLHAGIRQEIVLSGLHKDAVESRYGSAELLTLAEGTNRNVTSSAPFVGVSAQTEWLKESDFLEVIDQIPAESAARFAVADPIQGGLPIFNGDVLILASQYRNCWVPGRQRFGEVELPHWAVYQDHLQQALELLVVQELPLDAVREVMEDATIDFEHPVIRPGVFRACVSGLRSMSSGSRQWIGISAESGRFEARCILDLCLLAQQQGIGTIGLTPFGTLLVRNVDPDEIDSWRLLLARHKLSSSPDDDSLGWLMPDSQRTRKLRARLAKALDKAGAAQAGCTVSLLADSADGESAVQISPAASSFSRRYDVSATVGFDSRGQTRRRVAASVTERELAAVLVRLFEERNLGEAHAALEADTIRERADVSTHLCAHCETVYDPEFGDPLQGIEPGTSFEHLPEEWCCPVCEAPSGEYVFRHVHQDKAGSTA